MWHWWRILCRFSILKLEHTKSELKQNLPSDSMLKKICLIYLVEGKITKINSHLHWSEPVGANPGPHLSSSSFRHRLDPLQIKRLMVDQDKQHTSWLTLISCRTERSSTVAAVLGCWNTEQIDAGKNKQSIAPYIHGFWSPLWTLCYRVSLSSQLCINQLKRKKNCGCGIVNISNGLWKREEGVSLPQMHIWAMSVCVCVSQLVICAAPSTSADIDSARSLSWPQAHQHTDKHIFVYLAERTVISKNCMNLTSLLFVKIQHFYQWVEKKSHFFPTIIIYRTWV